MRKAVGFLTRVGNRGSTGLAGVSNLSGSGGDYEELFVDAPNGLPVRRVSYDRRGKAAAINERVAFNLDPPHPELFEVPTGYDLKHLEANR